MTFPVSIAPRPSIGLSHHRIHEGNHFSVHKINNNIDPLFPQYFLIIPPSAAPIPSDTIIIHIIFDISADKGITVELFEDSDAANGAPLFVRNDNRNSTTPALVSVSENPAVASEGTRIFEGFAGTTLTGGEVAENDRDEDEIILKIGSKYLLKITPLAAGPNTNAFTEINWYDQRPSSPIPI